MMMIMEEIGESTACRRLFLPIPNQKRSLGYEPLVSDARPIWVG